MSNEKKYYWLKLYDDFFTSLRIKKLRRLAGGDTFVVIYLKMQLLAMKNDGIIKWKGLDDSFADELALDLDEDPDNVKVTLAYLISCGLAETSDNISYFFPFSVANTGSETSAAERMRKMRERNNVTPALRDRYTEIDKEKEKESDKELEKKKTDSFIHSSMHDEKLPSMVIMLRGYKERGWDEGCCYRLAESYGITREELDAAYEKRTAE